MEFSENDTYKTISSASEEVLYKEKNSKFFGYAFPVSNEMFGRILTPVKDGDIERSPPHLRGILSRISAACTSTCQSAEWGMGSVATTYRILERKLPSHHQKRGLMLNTLYKLYNYRVRTTGMSNKKLLCFRLRN